MIPQTRISYNKKIYDQLEQLGVGLYPTGWFGGGWISIDKKDYGYDVMYTSHKHYHQPLCGTAIIVAFNQNLTIGSVFQTILVLHIVDDQSEKQILINTIVKKLNKIKSRRFLCIYY